jgi:hypothetical protein
MKLNFALFIFLSLAITACVRPPEYPIEPQLEFVSISKSLVLQDASLTKITDTLFVVLSFTDGDGDIGFQDSKEAIVILDTRKRDTINDVKSLPFVPEQGAGNGITGEITLRLRGGCCTNTINGVPCGQPKFSRDTTSYEIYIKDRAGHESNRVKTPPIFIKCQ